MSGGGLDDHGLPPGTPLREDLEVSPRQARRLLESAKPPPLLVDVRTVDEHRRAAIAGALLIPLHELERRLDEVQDELEESPDRPVIVFCHHGRRSLRAVSFLKASGVPRARSMAGGIDLWSIDIDPAVPRYA
jgi:rhodanese-related sulfurtransferase